MVMVVVCSWPGHPAEFTTCDDCGVTYHVRAENTEWWDHEARHHEGDAFCRPHVEETPYVLPSREEWWS